MAGNSKLKVAFFQRKPRSVGNYSVEFIFNDVRERLAGRIDSTIVYSSYESKGLFPRLYNAIEAIFKQATVNHITGDINYLGIFLSRRKTIHTVLDCVHLATSSGLKHKVLKLFWLSIPIRKAVFVTAISESTKREILKHISCPPEKIKVIYVAISDKFKRSDRLFNKEYPRILQVGAAANKNIPRLIEALKGIPCKLVIIGAYVNEYAELMKLNSVEYEYKQNLSEEEMIDEYRKADIISLASTYEGFGMPILEAQAIGRPVITSNIFSMPEVAGDAAYLADPFDVNSIRQGILQIIQDDDYRNELLARGFKNIKKFNADVIASEYYNVYKEVADLNK